MAGKITRAQFIRRGAGAVALAGLGAGGLAACGGERDAQGGSGEPVTIEYWHVNDETFGGPAIEELVSRFNERNQGVTVRQRFQDGLYEGLLENLQTSLAANDPPDVAQMGYPYLDYVTNNFPFSSMEDLADQYGSEGFFGGFPEDVLELGRVGGRQVAMPYAISNMLAYYNADMFSRAGLDPDEPPQTWEGWRDAARAIRGELDKPGLYIGVSSGDTWAAQTMIGSNGGQILGCEGGEAGAAFDGPEAVEAVRFWAELIDEDLALNVDREQGEPAFLSEEVAVYFNAISAREGLQEQASFELRGARCPTFGGKELELAAGGNTLFVFSQEDARRRAAWEFVRFLESPEALTAWTKGTGYLPPRDGVADDPRYLGGFVRDNPIQAVAQSTRRFVVPWVSFPGGEGLEAQTVLFDGVQSALGGQATADAALKDAASRVNQMLSGASCA